MRYARIIDDPDIQREIWAIALLALLAMVKAVPVLFLFSMVFR